MSKLFCRKCPDRVVCDEGYPCGIVKTIYDIPIQKAEEPVTMSNVKRTLADITAEATDAAHEKAEEVKTAVRSTERADALVEADNLIKQAGEKLAQIGEDDSEATHFVIRIPKFKTLLETKKHLLIGIGSAAVLGVAAIVKYNQTHKVSVTVDVEDKPEDDRDN